MEPRVVLWVNTLKVYFLVKSETADDIGSTAIEEGAFGLIPGVGGALTKGGLRAGSKVVRAIGKPDWIARFLSPHLKVY